MIIYQDGSFIEMSSLILMTLTIDFDFLMRS